ncbi:MAG TPA: phosphoribosylanthranilate isomerase [Dehalococcoidia bacterium]|nr:phosphoribosylanthranilate isomerase [Dehalococcoidia bacterium]
MTRVKICGCMRVRDAIAAAEAGADFIGVMFADSRRRVTIEEAAQIVGAIGGPLREVEQEPPVPHHASPRGADDAGRDLERWFADGAAALDRLLARKRPLVVGVFADQPIEQVDEIADEIGLDIVQLSGHEPWSDCLLVNRQAIKAVRTDMGMGDGASDVLAAIEPASIAVMLDESRGTGTPADREVARALAARLPLWLAGGLSPENVGDVIADVRPWCIDVSSGVETDGVKDAAKIRAFVAAAKGVRV